jgi:hypothetical protein
MITSALCAIMIKRNQTNTRPPPVVRSPLVAGVYKVTFKVILTSYQYDEIKWQNPLTIVLIFNHSSDILIGLESLIVNLIKYILYNYSFIANIDNKYQLTE